MRVIHLVSGEASPTARDGVNRVVHQIAAAQTAAGIPAEVWGISDASAADLPPRAYPFRLFAEPRYPWHLPAPIRAALAAVDADTVFHLHSAYLPVFYLFVRHLRRRGIQWVVSPHGGYVAIPNQRKARLKLLYVHLFERSVILGARRIHVASDTEEREMRRFGRGVDTVKIPYGYDRGELFCQPTGLARPPGFLMAYLGRFVLDQKGLDLLVKAFALYRERGGEGRLLLVGDGRDEVALRRLVVERGVAEGVTFRGQTHGIEKFLLYADLDCFIHPSRWEGLPTALVEAAAVGLPLLVSRETNFGGYVEGARCGVVYDAEDVRALADGMARFERAKRNGELAAWGKRARIMADREFDWGRNGRLLVDEVYARVR